MITRAARLLAPSAGRPAVFAGLFKGREKSAQVAVKSSDKQPAQSAAAGNLEASATGQSAPLIAVLGAKGGVGTSTVAVNLAAAFAGASLETTLIDGNFQLPDIANLLGREASHSLLELTSRGQGIDRTLFDACRAQILEANTNFGVLLPPADGEAFIKSNLTQLVDCLEQVKNFTGIFVVDVPGHLDRHLVTLLDKSAKIVLVFEATISGVAACRRWLQIFDDLGYGREKIMLVVNRAGSKHKLVEEQLGSCLDDRNCWKIPNASNLTWDSSNQGIPCVLNNSGSAYARAVRKLAGDLQKSLYVR